jgi:GH15 family glucan-1,4-alpha-glucosidase
MEKHLHLSGYLNNKPVRVGNNAVLQTQNDVYGQLLVTLLPLFIDERLNYYDKGKTIHMTDWLLSRIAENIDKPDSGLWEFGSTYQHHIYTYIFHWAGAQAAIKIGKYFGDKQILESAENLYEKATSYIERCYNTEQKAYTQAINNAYLDASSLQLILMRYLEPDSEIALEHLKAHEKQLFSQKGLFFRYTRDELGTTETSFLICGFWYAEALACVGRLDDSFKIIETLLNSANHLGLLSEDADRDGGQWGNIPQTYSHVGLINAVFRLAMRLDKPVFFEQKVKRNVVAGS